MHEASMFQNMLVYTPIIISSYLSTTFDSDSTYFDPTCVWYCGCWCGCGLKKVVFIKIIFSWGWFGKIYVWLTLWLKLRLNKK